MNKEVYLKMIIDSLSILKYQVECRNAINLYDINIISEDFFRGLLNKVYGYDLVNLNILEKNSAAIDLGDLESKISIQVTSTNDSSKIDKTITKFIEKKLYHKYDKLIFLMLVNKKKYTKTFDTKGLFVFDKSADVIDVSDVIKKIKEKDTDEIQEIADFMKIELDDKVNKVKKTQASEIETIVKLIEHLSSNKNIVANKKASVTDPDHKIYTRFKEYSEFLTRLYIGLVTIYGATVESAYQTLGLDSVKSLLISFYLQDISNTFLDEAEGNPKKALENLTVHFEELISTSGMKYDTMAIKFYLISETIKCNVFPNGGE
ncbi:SMEK domain-containing protein [Bacillus sp. RIT 809]|uniref:SMEK domain-containing protein n=1 Tax=Bacillus sp. RIT 809 TaxID=2803857 RepID=UPI00194F0D97|nr:SMEK domain-containing protein [Bacillus sp. RIT 809]MBM6645853.1 SMEK domain-containing protein [Bacillus sp. RIT 809]